LCYRFFMPSSPVASQNRPSRLPPLQSCQPDPVCCRQPYEGFAFFSNLATRHAPLATKLFRIRTSAKRVSNPCRMNTSQNAALEVLYNEHFPKKGVGGGTDFSLCVLPVRLQKTARAIQSRRPRLSARSLPSLPHYSLRRHFLSSSPNTHYSQFASPPAARLR